MVAELSLLMKEYFVYSPVRRPYFGPGLTWSLDD